MFNRPLITFYIASQRDRSYSSMKEKERARVRNRAEGVQPRTLGTLEIRLLQVRCLDQFVDQGIRVWPGHFDPAQDGISRAVFRFFPTLQRRLCSVQRSRFAETGTTGRISREQTNPRLPYTVFLFLLDLPISTVSSTGTE